MTIRLHIERLVLDGLPLAEASLPHVQAAVESRLTELLARGGLGVGLTGSQVVRSLRGGDVHVTAGLDDAGLGREIAGALYGGIGR
jgi:hypothetical protein